MAEARGRPVATLTRRRGRVIVVGVTTAEAKGPAVERGVFPVVEKLGDPIHLFVNGREVEHRVTGGSRLFGFRAELTGRDLSYRLAARWLRGVEMSDGTGRLVARFRTVGTFIDPAVDGKDIVVALLVAAMPLHYISLSILGLVMWLDIPTFEAPGLG